MLVGEIMTVARYEVFYWSGIKQLRNLKYSKGINIASGFSQRFKNHYGPNIDIRDVTNQLIREGKIDFKPISGGLMIYLPGEGPRGRLLEPSFDIDEIINTPQEEEETQDIPKKVLDKREFLKRVGKSITTCKTEKDPFMVYNKDTGEVERRKKSTKPKRRCTCKKK